MHSPNKDTTVKLNRISGSVDLGGREVTFEISPDGAVTLSVPAFRSVANGLTWLETLDGLGTRVPSDRAVVADALHTFNKQLDVELARELAAAVPVYPAAAEPPPPFVEERPAPPPLVAVLTGAATVVTPPAPPPVKTAEPAKAAEPAPAGEPQKTKRVGRPKGSKNKPKEPGDTTPQEPGTEGEEDPDPEPPAEPAPVEPPPGAFPAPASGGVAFKAPVVEPPKATPAPAAPAAPTELAKVPPEQIMVRQQRKITTGLIDVMVNIEVTAKGWKLTAPSIPGIEAWGSTQQQAIDAGRDQIAQWYAQSSASAERKVAAALEEVPDTHAAGLEHQEPPPPAATPEAAANDQTPIDLLADLPPDVASYKAAGEALCAIVVWYLQKNPAITAEGRSRKEVHTDLMVYLNRVWPRVPLVREGKVLNKLNPQLISHIESSLLTSYYSEYLKWPMAGEERDVFGKR
jgi:hypothetical protein